MVAGYMVFYHWAAASARSASTTALAHTRLGPVLARWWSILQALALLFWAFTARASARTSDSVTVSRLTRKSFICS